jgi:hypothetical protein
MNRIIISLAVSAIMGLASNAQADCSNETLHGNYALRTDATPTTGGRRQNLALLRFNGNGTYDNLGFTVNFLRVMLSIPIAAEPCSTPTGRCKGPSLPRKTAVSFTSCDRTPPT